MASQRRTPTPENLASQFETSPKHQIRLRPEPLFESLDRLRTGIYTVLSESTHLV